MNRHGRPKGEFPPGGTAPDAKGPPAGPPTRPKGACRSAKPEGTPVRALDDRAMRTPQHTMWRAAP